MVCSPKKRDDGSIILTKLEYEGNPHTIADGIILIEMQFVVLCSLMRILSLQNTTVLCVGGIHEAYSNSSTENQWNFL